MYIYYPSNAVVYTRQVGGPNMVTEQWIGSGPDSVIIISGSYPPTASTAFISASYAIVYTTSMSLADSASWAGTASYSLNALGTPSASYAGTSSFLNPVVPAYGATSSFNPSSSISQGQLILWVIPGTGSYLDTYGQYPTTTHGQQLRRMTDFSGLGRHIKTPEGTMNGYTKFMQLTNTGQNNNKPGLWIENVNACSLQSAAISSPTYPLWLFIVAKMPTGSAATTGGVFDGLGGSNRFLCQVGTTTQIYSGASFTGAITGSLTGSIQTKWFLQAFKNTAGGNNSSVYTNGTQSLVGNCGGQTILGYSVGGDYLGNGGGISIAELMLYSNITDADAANISTYLMGKHELFY
jgi:hypothetical protein